MFYTKPFSLNGLNLTSQNLRGTVVELYVNIIDGRRYKFYDKIMYGRFVRYLKGYISFS